MNTSIGIDWLINVGHLGQKHTRTTHSDDN
jgi:hypothetical protein